MKKIKKRSLFIRICLLFTMINIPALATGTINLMDVKIMEEDAKVKINFITNKPAIKYDSFTIDKPPSIVINFPNTQCTEKELNIGRNGITRINFIPQEGPNTKAVISLIKLIPYQIQQLKEGIQVIIDNPYHVYQLTAINVKEDESKISVSIASTSPPQYKYFDISNPNRIIIDFLNATTKIGETKVTSKVIKNIIPSQRQVAPVNVARVIVELTEFMPYQVFSDENQVVLELTKYPVVKDAEKTPPTPPKEVLPKVKEAPPIVKKIPPKIGKDEEHAVKKIVQKPPIVIKEEITPALEVKDIKSKSSLPKVTVKEEEKPTLSIDFKEADILDVLRLIAHKVGMNVLPGKDVAGVITVKLEDVPWRKALDLILRNLGYAYLIDGNIIRVDIPTLLLGDTITQIFSLNYAKASDMVSIVTNMMTTLSAQQARQMGGKVITGVGTVIADARTNALIVTDIPYNVNQITQIIKKLDTMTPQVMIEARIVEVTVDSSNMFGFRWGVTDKENNFTFGSYQTEGWAMGDRGEFKYAKITTGHTLDLEIQALVTEGKANVLSTPKILALDNEQASIVVGKDIPYQQTTSSKEGMVQTNVSFRQTGIKLTVTPHINPDNFILLDVKPEVSSLADWAYGMPVINTKEATSKLVVKDGETVVIGGIIDDQGTEKINKVPFFGDLPFVGPLFRKKMTYNYKKELLIFITPYIKKYM